MTVFDIHVAKAGGEKKTYARGKINYALRTLWRQKNLDAAFITYRDGRKIKWWLFGKFERKRAMATGLSNVDMPSNWPGIENHLGWKRLPNKWNKIT